MARVLKLKVGGDPARAQGRVAVGSPRGGHERPAEERARLPAASLDDVPEDRPRVERERQRPVCPGRGGRALAAELDRLPRIGADHELLAGYADELGTVCASRLQLVEAVRPGLQGETVDEVAGLRQVAGERGERLLEEVAHEAVGGARHGRAEGAQRADPGDALGGGRAPGREEPLEVTVDADDRVAWQAAQRRLERILAEAIARSPLLEGGIDER